MSSGVVTEERDGIDEDAALLSSCTDEDLVVSKDTTTNNSDPVTVKFTTEVKDKGVYSNLLKRFPENPNPNSIIALKETINVE